jgi:sugar lactone lactonase YvrE
VGKKRVDRWRWLVVFSLFLCAVLTAPVFADSPPDPPPPSSNASDEVPSPHDVAAGIAGLEQKEAEQQAALESNAAIAERADSQQQYTELSAEEARSLFQAQFAEQLEDLNSDPARFLSDARLDRSLEGGTAALVSAGGSPELLEAGIPVQAANQEGVAEKVSLSIVEAGDEEGFELANPLTVVTMPETASEGVAVGEDGLTITQVGAREDSTAEPFGDKNLFYASAQADTDLVMSPVARGVELSDQLRSSDSPETLRFALELPSGSELKPDGNGGAEVVAAGKSLAHVPFPTAVDAQGAEVPVELTVNGHELIIDVAHAGGEFAYPIDVDPLVEDWYNASWYSGYNLGVLTDGTWGWNPNTNWIYGSTTCFWSCWGSGRGLYIGAESGWHGGYQQGQWAYGINAGPSAFISSALISPFWRNNYANCPKEKYPQPHDYDGIWSEQNGWWPLETNRANDYGNANPGGHGRALIIGLGNAEVGAEDKCRRDIMAGGVAVWLTDPEPPSWTSMPSVADQWIDTTPIPVSASASDPGLGMKYFNLWTTNASGQNETLVGNAVHPCTGLHASPCPSSWSAQITNYNPAALPNGILKMDTVAYDALGMEHNSAAGPMFLKVDHLNPEIAYSGELLSEHPVKYHLNVTGTDGNSGSLATAQSGMKSLQFYVDGQLARREPETANPPACVNMQEGRNVGSCQFANVGLDLNRSLVGKHTLKIVAIDSLNHESEKTIEVNLPADTTAPALTPSGPLYTAANGWINAGETSVTASATDAETGVVEEAVYIDNKLVGSPFKQECFYGGCSMSHTFSLSLASYSEGSHTVKLIAKDGAGKVAENSWTVKVDSALPTLSSISAPEVPAGWTPQVTSFNLSYHATDAGSGIKKVEVSRPGVGGSSVISTPYNSACMGSAAAPCSTSVEGSTAISTSTMAQGADTVTVKAYDAFNHVSSTKTLTVRVDREGPAITPSGPLLTGGSSSLIGLVTNLNLGIKDPGSGVESLEIQLDGEPVEAISLEEILASGGSQSCGGESCELHYGFSPVVGEAVAPGLHTVKLVAIDKAGHISSVSHGVTIDTRPPELTLSGSLAEAAGEPLPTQIANLIAEAKDGEGQFAAGLANLKIEVDGNDVFFEQSTATGGTPQEHMWAVDENNNRVQEFNEKGEFVNAFGSSGSGKGQFSRPTAVALDAKGNLWVTDAGNNRIEEFTENGQFRRAIGSYGAGNAQFYGPEAIAIDASGNIWVADTYNARIQELNEKGEFIRAFGTRGSGSGQLIEPTGISIGPDGNVWVADWGNNKVAEFKANGEFIRQFGSEGTGNGQFKRPDTIMLDAKGNVWVGDEGNSRIQEFSQSGEYKAQFGTAGSGSGQFSFGYPMGLAVDSTGLIWVSDTGHNRIQKWNPGQYVAGAPTYVSAFGSSGTGNGQFAHPAGSAVDAKGNIWVADESNNRVEKFNPAGEFQSAFGSSGTGNGQFSRPTDVAATAAGNLWITDAANNRLEEFNEKGEFLKSVGSYGTGNLQFNAPESVTVDSKGNIWVGDTYNHRVQELNEKGEFVRAFGTYGTGQGQIVESTGIAIGPGGNVWVADWGNQRIEEFSETGGFIRQFGSSGTGNSQFSHPDVIEVDSKGDVWVGDEGNSRIQEFNQSGGYVAQFGTAGTGVGQFSFGWPMGITSDSQGHLWVSDTGHNRIQKWQIPNWGATYVSAFGSSGTGNGQFAHPAGITIGMTHGCVPPGCPLQQATTYQYDEGTWGTGPHDVVVTATDAAGNTDTEELHVNEPLNVVAPPCPTATPQVLPAGTVVTPATAVSTLASTLPSAVEASEPIQKEVEAEATEGDPAIIPAVTRNPEEVSLDEKGIDVVGSIMGGGIEDQAAGAFTVGQATCLQPLQEGAAASAPIVSEGSAVVFANALPDTDTLVRPTALGTTIVENLRGPQAPTEFKWAAKVGSGEELVELPQGGIAIVNPSGADLSEESYPSEPAGGWSLEDLNNVETQVEQAERELAMANNEIEGEVTAVIAPPEVVMEGGEVVPGLLKVTPGQVVVAELPPGTFAEAEALIIKANPAAEPEDICARVVASAPQYYPGVCGREHEPGSGPPDPSETLVAHESISNMPEPQRAPLLNEMNRFDALFGEEAVENIIEVIEEMTDEEKAVCLQDIPRCEGFYHAALKAEEIEDKVFTAPPGSQNTKGNAFKHSFWTLEMEVENNFNQSGLLFAQAHEGKEYSDKEHPWIRKESQMDMMSDWVGEWDAGHKPQKKLTACNDMLSKMGDAIFIGRDPYPFRWGHVHEWERYRPIFRMWVDWRSGSAETVVVRNGRTCPEVWG